MPWVQALLERTSKRSNMDVEVRLTNIRIAWGLIAPRPHPLHHSTSKLFCAAGICTLSGI